MTQHVLNIGPDGSVRSIYQEEVDIAAALGGTVTIERASHVEPDARGGWSADMRPVGGPILGPFRLRSEALAAEVAWIEEFVL